MQKYTIHEKYTPLFKKFTTHIKNYFLKNGSTIHKARNELKIIKYKDINCVVKSFKVPNILNQIVYSYFRDSKAKKSYNYSIKIGDYTPQPISYIEFYKFGLLKESYFISEHFDYDFTIREPLLEKNFKDRENIFKSFARFTLQLHNSDIFHNDYSPGNILIKKWKDEYIFKIVDINRMMFYSLTQEDRAKNFSKLWADDAILKNIVIEYKKHYSCDETFLDRVIYYSNHNKKVKNLKKRLKGKEVLD
jgi:hypothetical protein